MKYLCLAYGEEKDWNALSKSEQDELLAQDDVVRGRGALVAAVQPTAATVRAWDGTPQTTAGTFADSRAPLAGFSIIEAANVEEVVQLVAETPCARAKGAIEVRSISAINDDEWRARRTQTENKKTVERYIDGFRKTDHKQILSCLADDVEWEIPGWFHVFGKAAFDKEIENDAFVGSPELTIARLTEENDVVIAEGTLRAQKRDGGFLNALYCDAFTMKNARIKRLVSYLMELK